MVSYKNGHSIIGIYEKKNPGVGNYFRNRNDLIVWVNNHLNRNDDYQTWTYGQITKVK